MKDASPATPAVLLLPSADLVRAAQQLWWEGADTFEIAELLDVSEAAVANSLSRRREITRGAP